ncbi:TPA: hypothetical protein UL936_001930 [Stenotrophomonas maltophilia]|nr:hypothetical protein [Stenotrophomonas maltophilia]
MKTLLPTVLVIALAACSQQAPTPVATPPAPEVTKEPPSKTILGLTLSEQVQLEECEKERSHGSIYYATFPANAPCWKPYFTSGTLTMKSQSMPNEGSIAIVVAGSMAPSGIDNVVEAQLVEGRAESIKLETLGTDQQEDILRLLTEKWGKATSSSIENLQNGFGARFEGVEAYWAFDDFSVHYFGMLNREKGIILIKSKMLADKEALSRPVRAESL